MKVVMGDGTFLDLPGVSEGVVVDHFDPYSKDGYSVVDTRFRMAGGVLMWDGVKEELYEHLKVMLEAIGEAEEVVDAELRTVAAMERMAVAFESLAVAAEKYCDWLKDWSEKNDQRSLEADGEGKVEVDSVGDGGQSEDC
jgi:hypothetical protein